MYSLAQTKLVYAFPQEDSVLKATIYKSAETKNKELIKSLEKELKALQENCNHPDHKIMNCPSENTTFALRKVCVKCDKEIGYPSQQETDDWVKA